MILLLALGPQVCDFNYFLLLQEGHGGKARAPAFVLPADEDEEKLVAFIILQSYVSSLSLHIYTSTHKVV